MDELLEIANHVARADGPDRSIDGMIAHAIDCHTPDDPAGWPPRYTASLDAAASLIPEGFDWILERVNDGMTIGARVGHNDPDRTSWGDTPALALCAAALRARVVQQSTGDSK